MKRTYMAFSGTVLSITALLFLFQNCGYQENRKVIPRAGSSTGAVSNSGSDSLELFGQTLHPILKANCAQCHGVNQAPRHSVNEASQALFAIESNSLVNLDSPADSAIVNKIRGGHQSFPATLADDLQDAITNWGNGVASIESAIDSNASGINPNATVEPTYTSVHEVLISQGCISCHRPDGQKSNASFTSYVSLFRSGAIVPGDADQSPLYIRMANGTMPPAGREGASPAQLSAVAEWINQGAANN